MVERQTSKDTWHKGELFPGLMFVERANSKQILAAHEGITKLSVLML